MTEPTADGTFKFDHPEQILTAETALDQAAALIAEHHSEFDLKFAISKALLEAWHAGALFANNESAAMTRRVIERGAKAAIAEYLEKQDTPREG